MRRALLAHLFADYGMALVLVLLCVYYSIVTVQQQHPTGATAARQLAKQITTEFSRGSQIVIVTRDTRDDIVFADSLSNHLTSAEMAVHVVTGGPAEARALLQALSSSNAIVSAVACAPVAGRWALFDDAANRFSALAKAKILVPTPYRWPNFLKRENLLNIVNQIAVIAIVAVGMTLVIITGGIDLSVGSLIALSAVIATLLIRDLAGAEQASSFGMFLCCAVAILICAFLGFISGLLVAVVSIPPFIATLGMMLVGSGLAFITAAGQSIYQVPDSFVWLGRGAEFGIPNSVLFMALLYAATHLLMNSTRLGRYIYAVGGNAEAARLSGVSVKAIGLFVYSFSGALAGLGGIVTASQLKSGSPTYGGMYELYVIAAVVVGGTSLVGGEGKVLGTLIGAFIIAVIQNGMNLTGVESYTQKVVLGLVILGAVMLDMLKRHGAEWFQAYRRRAHHKGGVGTLLLAATFLAGCGEGPEKSGDATSSPAPNKSAIGLSVLTLANPFFKEISDTMTAEAARQGYAVQTVSGDFDVARQQNQVKDFIVRRVAAIVLTPCDSKAIGPAIKEANDAGIPVFTADIACLAPGVKVVTHVATDNYGGGKEAAKAMIEALGENGGKVGILHHALVESCILRVKGFRESIEQYNVGRSRGKIEIVAELPGGGVKDQGFRAAQDLLQAHSDLAGIFAINDPSALGARAAVEKAGKTDQIRIIGFDGQPEGKQAIKEGKIYADPIQFPDQIGRQTVEAIVKHFAGETLPPEILIPTALYRKADAEKELK